MAKKKRFIFYNDWVDYLEAMAIEEKAEFLEVILQYQNGNEVNPATGFKYIWPRIKKQMDEDRIKRENKVEVAKTNGKNGGRPKKDWDNMLITDNNLQKPTETYNNQKKPVNVNVNVKDNVNKIYNKIVNENLVDFLTPTELDNFVAYWSETIQQGKYKGKERWEGQKTWDTKKRINTWNKNKQTNFGKEIEPTNDTEWIDMFDNIKKSGGSIGHYKDKLGKKEYKRLYDLRHQTKVMDVLLNN